MSSAREGIVAGEPTSSARDDILARIRTALADVDGERDELPRDYDRSGRTDDRESIVAQFAATVADYRATVRRVRTAQLRETIATVLADAGLARVAVSSDFPSGWLPDGLDLLVDPVGPDEFAAGRSRLTAADLDGVDAAVTTAALGIAVTGTLVLNPAPGTRLGQGRRLLTLVPDFHLCIVAAADLVATIPEAVAAMDPAGPVTLVSGPSATSDIELNRVEGVHGPRTLVVLIVDD